MSSISKKQSINSKSEKETDKLQKTFDLYHDFAEYEKSIKEEGDVKKIMIANEIARMGEAYIQEIDIKQEEKEKERQEMVDYIIQTTEQTLVKKRDLDVMSYEEVKSIYIKAQDTKKSWYRLLFEFLMGW